jgi:hypothetical protein
VAPRMGSPLPEVIDRTFTITPPGIARPVASSRERRLRIVPGASGEWLVCPRCNSLQAQVEVDGILYVHGSPLSDVESFPVEPSDDDERMLAGVRDRTVVFGHSHLQFNRPGPNGTTLINPGSAGLWTATRVPQTRCVAPTASSSFGAWRTTSSAPRRRGRRCRAGGRSRPSEFGRGPIEHAWVLAADPASSGCCCSSSSSGSSFGVGGGVPGGRIVRRRQTPGRSLLSVTRAARSRTTSIENGSATSTLERIRPRSPS